MTSHIDLKLSKRWMLRILDGLPITKVSLLYYEKPYEILDKIFNNLFFLVVSHGCFAQASSVGPFSIKSIRASSAGIYFAFSPAPSSCNGGDQYRMHVFLSTSHANYKGMLATLLLAKATDQKIQYIWVTGSDCSSTSILTLDMMELVEAKP